MDHSRGLEKVPVNSRGLISYYCSIVTIGLEADEMPAVGAERCRADDNQCTAA